MASDTRREVRYRSHRPVAPRASVPGRVEDFPIAVVVAVDDEGVVALRISASAYEHVRLEVVQALRVLGKGAFCILPVSAVLDVPERGPVAPSLAVVDSHAELRRVAAGRAIVAVSLSHDIDTSSGGRPRGRNRLVAIYPNPREERYITAIGIDCR